MTIVPVILSGGSGTRLWPLSRELYPKQFLALAGEATLLQDTVQRLDGVTHLGDPVVVCNEAHRFLVAEQFRAIDIQPQTILLEPEGKNTAPALGLAAFEVARDNPDAVLVVLPADHIIQDTHGFQEALEKAVAMAVDGHLVTFGIQPRSPHTGYGYIRRGHPLGEADGVFAVQGFVEKPDQPTAEGYVASGEYDWNSGMFVGAAQRFLDELERFAPTIHRIAGDASGTAQRDLEFTRVDAEIFAACPKESIDYAVMEHTDAAVVVSMDVGWDDVGAWSSLWEVGSKDEAGNVVSGDVVLEAVQDSYVAATNRLVAALGVQDQIIVETGDAVLVAARDRVQDVKTLVNRLRADGRHEPLTHRQVHRPWGTYETIALGHRFQVKRIRVKPGASLSLQMHHHRAEHWVVVEGTARITRDEDSMLLSEDQSTYIPLGTRHRLENPGVIPLEIIEVQSGSYLGEDDIVRFEDHYGRG